MTTTETMSVADALSRGLEHHRAGRLSDAEPVYRAILKAQPDQPDALHLLGLIAQQTGHHAAGLELVERAVTAAPRSAVFRNSLGAALRSVGRTGDALRAFQQALEIKPDYEEARANLAAVRAESAPVAPPEAEKKQWREYQAGVDRQRLSPYMDYPAHVHMETASICNAACNFCPYPQLTRQGTRMPDALIEKIVDDLTDVPSWLPFQLSPFKVNEPFLDTRLFDILRQCNERLPNATLTLTSNASPITEKKLAQLAEVRNLHYLWISMNDHRPAEYERTMQLKYDRTIERLDMIHRAVEDGRVRHRVVLSRVGDRSAADGEFCRWVGRRYPRFEASVFPRGAWLGQVDTEIGVVPQMGCIRWFDVSITATGKVAHCCMDGQAQWPIGDVTKQHVLAIYNDPNYRRLREHVTTRQEVEPCNACTFQ